MLEKLIESAFIPPPPHDVVSNRHNGKKQDEVPTGMLSVLLSQVVEKEQSGIKYPGQGQKELKKCGGRGGRKSSAPLNGASAQRSRWSRWGKGEIKHCDAV